MYSKVNTFFFTLGLLPGLFGFASAAEFEVMDKLTANGYTVLKSSAEIRGLVGISTGTPYAALDVVSTGTAQTEFAQIWRDGSGVVKGSMSATGVMQAVKFVGSGAGLTGISGDNLGDHTATQALKMGVYAVGTSSHISAAAYQVLGSTVLSAAANGTLRLGAEAGRDSTGSNSIYVGYRAGYLVTTSVSNTFVGVNAGSSTLTAGYNTFIGNAAGQSNTVGNQNVLVGFEAGLNNISGAYNVMLGPNAGRFHASGSDNVFIGVLAGANNTLGARNILIGDSENTSSASSDDQINIGGVFFGDRVSNIAGVNILPTAAALEVKSTGTLVTQYAQIWRNSSGVEVASMTATGKLWTAVPPAGDNLGDHLATTALNMNGFILSNVSTITMLNGSIAITPPGTGGSNNDYGISIGSDSYNSYSYGVSIGKSAKNNYDNAVGIGAYADDNYSYGVGVGNDAKSNYTGGVGVGRGAQTNYNEGVGVGYFASNNRNNGVGIGSQSSGNSDRGVGVGYYSYNNYAKGVGVGNEASDNNRAGVGVGYQAFSNNYGGVGVGVKANYNSDYGVGIGSGAANNYLYGVGVGANASNNKYYAVGIGAYSQNNKPYGAALGAYSYAASSSVALGYAAQANADNSVAIGSGTVNNTSGTASFGMLGVYTSSDVFAAKFHGNGSGLTGISGDNLGGHTAEQNLNMASFNLVGVSSVNFQANVFLTSATAANYGGLYASTHVYVSSNIYVAGFGRFNDGAGAPKLSLNTADRKLYASDGTTVQLDYSVARGISMGGAGGPFSGAIFIGYLAGVGATSANTSNFMGYSAGYGAVNAYESNFMGNTAGYGAVNANSSNFLGVYAGWEADNAHNSNFLGPWAGDSATNASYSNFLGYQAGQSALNASSSTFIGYYAGYNADNAKDSIFLGSYAGYNDTVSNAAGNTSIAIGRYSGTGGYSNSVAIGRGVINSAARQLNLGNVLYATNIYNSDTPSAMSAGGLVGISTGNPQAALDIVSTGTASNVYAQIWRNSSGVEVASMTATGKLWTAVPSADNLGNHTATNRLDMAGKAIDAVSSVTISGTGVTGVNPVFAVAGSTFSILVSGNVGVGTAVPGAKLEVVGASRITSDGASTRYAEETVFERTLPAAQDSYVEIGKFNTVGSQREVNFEVDLNGFNGSGGHSKKYVIVANYDDIQGIGWKEVLPLYNTGERGGEYALDLGGTAVTSGAELTLRLRTTRVLPAPEVILARVKAVGPSLAASLSGTGTGASVTGLLRQAGLTQVQGNVGIGIADPGARLDIVSTGTTANVYAQIWRNSSGVEVASMTATGKLWTAVPSGDNLGDHDADTRLNMGGYAVWSSSNITAAAYQIGGSTVLAILPGTSSFAAGPGAGAKNVGGQNTFFGAVSGKNNSTGFNNTFIGQNSGYDNNLGFNNTFVGQQAGYENTQGSDNTYLGVKAGNKARGSANVILGYEAAGYMFGATPTFSSATIVGNSAGYNLSTGADNILVGFNAGYAITTGTGNIVIGYDKGTTGPTVSNQLNVGGLVYGDLSNRTLGIGRVPTGIQAALDVVSTGTLANQYAQIWRDSDGVVKASMTADGKLYATLPNVSGDNLGNHRATQGLDLDTFDLVDAGSITAASGSAAAPSYSFTGNSEVGMFRPGVDLLAFTNGSELLRLGYSSGYTSIFHTGGTLPPSLSGTLAAAYQDGVSPTPQSPNFTALASANAAAPAFLAGRKSRGTLGAPAAVVSGDSLVALSGLGYVGAGNTYIEASRLDLGSEGAIADSPSGIGGVISLHTRTSGSGLVERLKISSTGNVGISTGAPQARLDVLASGSAATDFVQIWRNSGGNIVSSMSATGVLYPKPAGDNLGDHAATQNLSLAGYDIVNASSITVAAGKAGLTVSTNMFVTGGNLTVVNGRVITAGGTAAAPAYSIAGDLDTGMYASQSSTLMFSVDSSEKARFNVNGFRLQAGSAANPALADTSSGSYGLYFPAGALAFSASGTEAARITAAGNVGLSTGAPQARLDVLAAGSAQTDMAQIWRDSNGAIKSSMSATGVLMAARFVGDGSGLTGIAGDDDLGNHTATQDLNLASFALTGVSTISASGLYISSFGVIQTAGPGLGGVAGVARGAGAVDLQAYRAAAGNVAGGAYAVLTGGASNTAGGAWAVVSGGASNSASNNYAAVAGGNNNTASGANAFVAGGTWNTALGDNSFAAGRASSSTAQGSFTWSDSRGEILQNDVADRTIFKNIGGFLVTGSTNPVMSANVNRGLFITGRGLIGVSTGAPQAAMDMVGTGASDTNYLHIWRNNSGVIVASMTSTGKIFANISAASGGGDDLGDHIATADLAMAGYNILGAQHVTADGPLTTYSTLTVAGSAFSVGVSTFNVRYGRVGIGLGQPEGLLHVGDATLAGVVLDSRRNILTQKVPAQIVWAESAPYSAGDLLIAPRTDINGAVRFFTGTAVSERLTISGSGNVGISTGNPQARLDVVSFASTPDYQATIWRNGDGNVVSSVSATGVMMAARFIGDGSQLSNITGTDNTKVLKTGDTMTGQLTLAASTLTVTGALGVRAARVQFAAGIEVSSYSASYGTGLAVSTLTYTPGLVITSFGELHTSGSGRGSEPGSPRGAGAVDLQVNRSGASQVASGGYATISGGQQNTAAGLYSVAAGGSQNTAGNQYSTVGGGLGNNASGDSATIPGGTGNAAAGAYSFASGRNAESSNDGSFTWADSLGVPVTNNVTDRVWFKAAGGALISGSTSYAMSGTVNRGLRITGNGEVGVGTYSPQAALDVVSTGLTSDTIAQYWRGNDGVVVASMSSTGYFKAVKFIGDGSELTGAGDDLGDHTATADLNMAQKAVVNITTLAVPSTTAGLHISTGGTGSLLSTDGLYIDPGKGIYFTGKGNNTVIGNARDFAAVDLQTYRTAATQVASGSYSTLSGGRENTASGLADTVAGGLQNTASGNYSAVSGGYVNKASGDSSIVSGGWTNTARGAYSTISGGRENTAGGWVATVSGGQENTALGQYSWAGGYLSSSTADGSFTWADSAGVAVLNNVTDRTWFKNRGGFLVTGSTQPVSDGAFFVSGQGNVGISNNAPQGLFQVGGGTLTVTAAGNVGVGLADPVAKLHVQAYEAGKYTMQVSTTAANGSYSIAVTSTGVTNINNLVIENRTSDPAAPVVGQIWLRVD